jgi:hypothetical protein
MFRCATTRENPDVYIEHITTFCCAAYSTIDSEPITVKQVGKKPTFLQSENILEHQTANPVFTPNVTERGLLCARYPQSKVDVLEIIAFRTVQLLLLLSQCICVFSVTKTPHLP